jgi:ABC-2 type transport system permease protein
MGALALRIRQGAVIGNVVFCVLLVFTGVNVPLTQMPPWMAHVASWLPLTHGIEAARATAEGASLASVSGLLGRELVIGAVYAVVGLILLSFFERESRRRATLERT